jgi:hypothetical protein
VGAVAKRSTHPSEFVGNEAAAEYLGMAASTWRAYVARGQAPGPDRRELAATGHALPVWSRETLDRYQRTRPGRGRRRTDAA